MRVVLDPNVLISAVLSPRGAPAALLRAWLGGEYELVVSPALIAELRRALAYPKLRKRVAPEEAGAFADLLEAAATLVEDPRQPPTIGSRDPDDDYLIALAETARSVLVSGDHELQRLAPRVPVQSPGEFVERLGSDLR